MRKAKLSALLVIFLLLGLASATFTISATEAEFESEPGEVRRYAVVVENPTDEKITVLISIEGELADYTEFERTRLPLDYEQSRDVNFKFTMPPDQAKLEGHILFSCCNQTEKTHIVINAVEPISQLLLVDINPLKPSYPPGSVGTFEITIFKFGPTKKETIPILYTLKGPSGAPLFESSDAKTFETSIAYDYKLQLEKRLAEGNYTLEVHAEFQGFETTGSAVFELKHQRKDYTGLAVPIFTIVALLLVGTLLKYYYDKAKSRIYRSGYKPSIRKSFVSATLEMLRGGGRNK